MAKKKTEVSLIRPGYKQLASKNCKLEHCMGKPKKLIDAETFDGNICSECMAVHEYKPQETIDAQERLELKEEKIKKKTLTTDEAELQKLIKAADEKDKKKVKSNKGEQLNLL